MKTKISMKMRRRKKKLFRFLLTRAQIGREIDHFYRNTLYIRRWRARANLMVISRGRERPSRLLASRNLHRLTSSPERPGERRSRVASAPLDENSIHTKARAANGCLEETPTKRVVASSRRRRRFASVEPRPPRCECRVRVAEIGLPNFLTNLFCKIIKNVLRSFTSL